MSTLAERIATLEDAIASGEKRVVFHSGGTRREVEYQSIRDMLAAVDRLKAMQTPGKSRIIFSAN